MQRVDGGYVYEMGDAIRSLRILRYKDVKPYELWGPLVRARQKVSEFLYLSVYSASLRSVHVSANKFIAEADRIIERMRKEGIEEFALIDLLPLYDAFDAFEPVLCSELSGLPVYLTLPKAAYEISILVEAGERLFPPVLGSKVPEAVEDAQQGGKALAFDLFTAAAFHFHRANEAVLRQYFDQVAGAENRPKMVTMGTLLGKLKKLEKGDEEVIAALDCLKKYHRNEISHPGEQIQDADEALSLVAAIHSSMQYMLREIPEPMTLPLGDETDISNLNPPTVPRTGN